MNRAYIVVDQGLCSAEVALWLCQPPVSSFEAEFPEAVCTECPAAAICAVPTALLQVWGDPATDHSIIVEVTVSQLAAAAFSQALCALLLGETDQTRLLDVTSQTTTRE